MMILIAPIPCVYSEFSFAYLLISVNSMVLEVKLSWPT